MNYRKIYSELVGSRKVSPAIGYTERHHIIPVCCGGNNHSSNLVNLTPEEHFIAHKLLAKIFPNNYGLIKAVIAMGMSSRTHSRQFNKSYGWERRRMAELQTGEGNPFYGKHHTEEHKDYMSKLFKNRKITWGDKISKTKKLNPTIWTEEAKNRHSIRQSGENNGMFGKSHSIESISKMKLNRPKQDGGKNPSAKPITIDGITYGCMKDATLATGLSAYKLRKLR